MKLYQLATAAVITLASIFSNPIESLHQKKLTISSASAQSAYEGVRIPITENTPVGEINHFFFMIDNLWRYNAYFSQADKQAMIEDLDKIQTLTEYDNYSLICDIYMIAEAYDKAVKACEKDLKDGKVESNGIDKAYIATKQYDKAIKSIKKDKQNLDAEKDGTYLSLLHQKLGSIYFTLGQYNEAIKEYKKGLKMLKENKEKIECKTCITDSFQLSSASFRSGLGFSYLKQGRKKKAYQEFLYAEMNDLSSWEQTVENLFNIDGNHYSGLWEGHLMGTVDSLFTEGLMELRLDEKQYIDALEVAEYGRTRVLSYSISKDQKSSINIDEIKAIAKEQNATLVKYSTPKSLSLDKEYEPKVYIWVVKPTGEVHFANVNLNQKNQFLVLIFPLFLSLSSSSVQV